MIIACLGLVGLSASLAERRTKEIGIRKAMGANTADILQMLLWQFTQPVLASIAVAWLVAGLLMNHWLHGFAEHVALDPGLMVTAAVGGTGDRARHGQYPLLSHCPGAPCCRAQI